jgi:hypothetical protein
MDITGIIKGRNGVFASEMLLFGLLKIGTVHAYDFVVGLFVELNIAALYCFINDFQNGRGG